MIYLASYRGRAGGIAGLVGAVIRWVTHSEHSHCELTIGDPALRPVLCISSSGMDGGVRAKRMQLNEAQWDITPLPWVAAKHVEAAYLAERGAGYDWVGAVRFALPVAREHPRRWFCSEFCAYAMGLDEPWRWSPADLHALTQYLQRGGKPPPRGAGQSEVTGFASRM